MTWDWTMSIGDLTNAYSAVHPRYLLAKKPQIRTEMVRLRTTKPDITVGPSVARYTNGTAQRSAARPGGERGRPRVERCAPSRRRAFPESLQLRETPPEFYSQFTVKKPSPLT